MQRVDGAADTVPGVGKIRFQGGAPETISASLEQLPEWLDHFPGRAQVGPYGVEPSLDRPNVQSLYERIADHFPRFLFDLSLVLPGLALDVADVNLETPDPGVDVPHRAVAEESASHDHGDSHIGGADAGRCPPANAKTGDSRSDEHQRCEDEQAGRQGGGILTPQGLVQRWRHPHPVDGVLELPDRRRGSHDIHRGLVPVLVQGKQHRHQKQWGDEQHSAAQHAGDRRPGTPGQVTANQQGGERGSAGNGQSVWHDLPSWFDAISGAISEQGNPDTATFPLSAALSAQRCRTNWTAGAMFPLPSSGERQAGSRESDYTSFRY